jgi:hypothetical protein
MGERGRKCVFCLVQSPANGVAQFGGLPTWIGRVLGAWRHPQDFSRRYLALGTGKPIAAAPAPCSFQNAFSRKRLEHTLQASEREATACGKCFGRKRPDARTERDLRYGSNHKQVATP